MPSSATEASQGDRSELNPSRNPAPSLPLYLDCVPTVNASAGGFIHSPRATRGRSRLYVMDLVVDVLLDIMSAFSRYQDKHQENGEDNNRAPHGVRSSASTNRIVRMTHQNMPRKTNRATRQ